MEHFERKRLPILAARNVVIFPGTTLPLNVGRSKSVAAIEAAKETDGFIVTVAQRADHGEDHILTEGDLYRVATLCKLEKVRGSAEHGFQVVVRGVVRVHIDQLDESGAYLAAEVTSLPDRADADQKTLDALTTNLKALAHDILKLVPADTRRIEELIAGIDDTALLTHLSAEYIDAPLAQKQEILEIASIKQRALKLLELMQMQKEALKLQSDIREKLSAKMSKSHREHILREQLKAIREELGEDDAKAAGDYEAKIEAAKMPEETNKVALDEARRLQSIGNNSPESHVIRNYLDLLCAMPWDQSSPEAIDLDGAKKSLDADHYGLDKIKKRIIQHLAVMKLKKSGAKAPILLFVGPPGVGKTSLGQSIAKAIGRKFARASLGGVRDDAEIRGHRRTYIGAMPGRIVQGIKRAGVNNPVFMLDEIDKLVRGYGDPAGSLLEVLDPEQNAAFSDHYLDVPFDLSKVLFIATANTLETIPGPLLDRMEVIDLSGYTTPEKLHIAKNHLIPKKLAEYGIEDNQLKLADDALMRLITSYTREAGVRDLERKIGEVVRVQTEKVVSAASGTTIRIELADLDEVLGPERFVHEVAERVVPPGVVTGLAWTPLGGEILFIEASLMPGAGKLTLTGQLGDVMKESAQIALSLVRSNLPAYVPGFDYDKKDIHVHVPAGAIPKDGPSAGVTMLTTLASLFTGRRVNPALAMTGEITLRGAVLPVGGIKEKVMAAHRAGIEKILMSRRNQKDLRDVPEDVRSQLKFEFVDTVQDVLKVALDLDVSLPSLGTEVNKPLLPPAALS